MNLRAAQEQESKIILSSGDEGFALVNDGKSDALLIRRSNSLVPLVVLEAAEYDETRLELHSTNHTGPSDAVLSINAASQQESQVILAAGEKTFSMVHSGATDTFNIQRGGIHTPILSIATPITEVFDIKPGAGINETLFRRKVLPQHQWSSEVSLAASAGQTAKISLVEGRQSYSIENDGASGKLQVTRSGLELPVLTIENELVTSLDASGEEGAQTQDLEWNMAHQQGWSSTMTLQASRGSDARLVLGEGSKSYSLQHVGAQGTFEISRAGDVTPALILDANDGRDTVLTINAVNMTNEQDTVLVVNAPAAQESQVILAAGEKTFSMVHSGATDTFNIQRGGIHTPISFDCHTNH
jgi:hypothetical protein